MASNPAPREQIHGTVVALGGAGVLFRGPPGAGKSDMALRMIDGGARLVADDRVDIAVRARRAVASAPSTLAGLIEARGIGVVRLRSLGRAEIRLVVDLVKPEQVERMPEDGLCQLAGISLPRITLAPFEASAVAKVRMALSRAVARKHGGGKKRQ